MPALILKWTAWQIAGHAAYLLLYVFVESVILFLIFLAIFLLIPRRWLQGQFVVQASMAVLLTAVWLILLQSGYEEVRFGGRRVQAFWLGLFALSHIALFLLLHHFTRLSTLLRRLWDRLAVLGGLYLVLDAIALVIVIVRNL